MIKTLYIAAGWSFVVLGGLGIALPLLPTTPFLLLAAACFARGSRKLHDWLLEAPGLGHYIRDYREHGCVPVRAKVVALALLWPSIGWTATTVVPHPAVGMILFLVAIGVTVFLLRLPSRQPGTSANTQPGSVSRGRRWL